MRREKVAEPRPENSHFGKRWVFYSLLLVEYVYVVFPHPPCSGLEVWAGLESLERITMGKKNPKTNIQKNPPKNPTPKKEKKGKLVTESFPE